MVHVSVQDVQSLFVMFVNGTDIGHVLGESDDQFVQCHNFLIQIRYFLRFPLRGVEEMHNLGNLETRESDTQKEEEDGNEIESTCIES